MTASLETSALPPAAARPTPAILTSNPDLRSVTVPAPVPHQLKPFPGGITKLEVDSDRRTQSKCSFHLTVGRIQPKNQNYHCICECYRLSVNNTDLSVDIYSHLSVYLYMKNSLFSPSSIILSFDF